MGIKLHFGFVKTAGVVELLVSDADLWQPLAIWAFTPHLIESGTLQTAPDGILLPLLRESYKGFTKKKEKQFLKMVYDRCVDYVQCTREGYFPL